LICGQTELLLKAETDFDRSIYILEILSSKGETFQPGFTGHLPLTPRNHDMTIPNRQTLRCRSLLEVVLDRVRGGVKVKAVVRLLLKVGETFNTEELATFRGWIESLDKESQTAFLLKTGILGNIDEISVSSSDEQDEGDSPDNQEETDL
jgi:hypothetical protein